MKRRKYALLWKRSGKLNDLYVKLKDVPDDSSVAFENGEWLALYYDYVDIGIGYESFVSGGDLIHKDHKVVFRMFRRAIRREAHE